MTGRDDDAGGDFELRGTARSLLDAVLEIGSDLDLDSVLRRIVTAAREMTGAGYGALLLPGADGEPVLSAESGAPAADTAPGGAALDIPIRVRGSVLATVHLAGKAGGAGFTEADAVLVGTLAGAAGIVVENARAYRQSERRRQWLEASAQIVEALQPPVRTAEALRQIAISARRASGAAAVAVVQHGEDGHRVAAADGTRLEQVRDLADSLSEQIAGTVEAPDLVVLPRGTEGTVVLVPLRAHLSANGVLLVALGSGRGDLAADEAELLATFADQASLALDRAQAIADREELLLVADRDRIARDLHDLVIQRLFATGLQLQSVRRIAISDEVVERLDAAVADLDVTIRDIRSTIFELQHSHQLSLRADLRAVAGEYVPVLGFTPQVRTAGPLDTAVPAELAAQLLAVLREALSNVARHAHASAATVEAEATAERLLLAVADDGVGLPAERHESGLRNVRRRAAEHGGAVRLLAGEPHGTRMEWSVPLRSAGTTAAPGSAGPGGSGPTGRPVPRCHRPG